MLCVRGKQFIVKQCMCSSLFIHPGESTYHLSQTTFLHRRDTTLTFLLMSRRHQILTDPQRVKNHTEMLFPKGSDDCERVLNQPDIGTTFTYGYRLDIGNML